MDRTLQNKAEDEDVYHIVSTNALKSKIDFIRLGKLNSFIYKIEALNNSKSTKSAGRDSISLWQTLYITEGARVQLCVNINAAAGLYIHSTGVVLKVLFKKKYDINVGTMPFAVLVYF